MENLQTTAAMSYSEPNSVPPSHREQHTDQKCITVDNDSDKQAMDGKEIEVSTSPSYMGQEIGERSQSSTETACNRSK